MTKRKTRKTPGIPQSPLPPGAPLQPAAIAKQRQAIQWKWLGLGVAIIMVVGLALYANTFAMGLVFNDTQTLGTAANGATTIVDPVLRPLTQPWVRASFVSDMSHYMSTFGWYHLVNVWLHISSCLALFLVVTMVARARATENTAPSYPYVVAGVAALVYACHPFAVQTATYLSARYASLGASNFLLALLLFGFALLNTGAIRIWCTLATLAFTLMCLCSSETSLALAPTMVALFFLLRPAKLSWKDWAIDHPLLLGITLGIAFVVPFYYLTGFQPVATPNSFGLPVLDRWAYLGTQCKAFLTYYTRCFFIPLGLSVDPPFTKANGFDDPLAIMGLLLIAATAYGAFRWRGNPLLFFGLWLTLAGFLPHALIIQPDAVADPAFYLSIAGLSLVVSWLMLEMWNGPIREQAPKVVAVLLALGAMSVFHNLDFSNDEALVGATLRTNKRSELALVYSAMEKLKKEDYAAAIRDSDAALAENPNSGLAYFTKGQAQLRINQTAAAKESLEKATQLAQQQHLSIVGGSKFALAEAYIQEDKLEKASQLMTDAIRAEPSNGRALYLLGLMSIKRRDYPQALTYLQRAMQFGIADARLPAARALLGNKQYDNALELSKVIVASHDSPEAELVLGNAALANNDLAAAEKALKAALKARPDSTEAIALLSIVYEKRNDKVLADSYHNDAVKRDPGIFGRLLLPGPAAAGKMPAKKIR